MVFRSAKEDRKHLVVTVYNGDFGLVKEKRELNLPTGETAIQYLDVAEQIEIESILVEGLSVLELNYDYDLVSKEKLLKKFIGKTVKLKRENTTEKYTLLQANDGLVLENKETKEILLDPKGELILPKRPEQFLSQPALIWEIEPSLTKEVNVSYLTDGMSWEAKYVLELDHETFNMGGWVEMRNQSGATYEQAKVKLIAGNVNRDKVVYTLQDSSESLHEDLNFEEKAFADYHMYTLERPATLKNNQTKLISFIQKEAVLYHKYYEYRFRASGVKVALEFDNTSANSLGIPLPAGPIKAYQRDKDGGLELIGEDRIRHTPRNEKIKLTLGEAFDVTCVATKIHKKKTGNGQTLETFRYSVKNHKNETVRVKLVHPVYEDDWEVVDCNINYETEDANHLGIWATIASDSETTVAFTLCYNRRLTVHVNKSKY